MRIPSIHCFVVFPILLLLVLLLSGIAVGDTTEPSDYTDLKQLVSDVSQSNPESIFTFLAELSTLELLQVAKEAAVKRDSVTLFSLIGPETIRRLRIADISPRQLLDELESVPRDDYYRKCFFLWVLDSSPQFYSIEDKRNVFVAAQQYIDRAKSPVLKQRIAAIVTSNSMLAWLVADGYADTHAVSEYGNQMLALASDWSEHPEIRRAAVKGIEEIRFREAIPYLLELLSDSRTLSTPPLARALCISLARFDAKEAVDQIGYILQNTTDEYVFGSAATALGDLGGESALRLLVENAKRFQGGFVGTAISRLDTLVLELLSSGENGSLITAIRASRYLYRSGAVLRCRGLLLDRLYSTSDKNLIRLILDRLRQIVTPDEASKIVEKIPYDSAYADEWGWLSRLARSTMIPSSSSSVPVDEDRESGGQEYGDAAYRELGLPFYSYLGHAGLYAGIDAEDSLRILEIKLHELDYAANVLFLVDVVHHNYWSGMREDPDFWCVHTPSNKSLTFEDRNAIMETAWTLEGYDIVGYPIFVPLFSWPDALNCYPAPGSKITPNEIKRLRCDGMIEYCYEYNGHWVWGKNGTNYDISQTANLEEHNYFYDGDPNTGLAPVVQCGRAGGSSTYMTRDALEEVDLPTYRVRYTQNGSTVNVRIKATDKSGIHYIKYKHGEQGNWVISDIQDQHPTSDNYEWEFPIYNMTESGYIYFYAKDNGGNYPAFADSAWIHICSGPPAPPVLVSPCSDATVSQFECLEWEDTPGATQYVVRYGLEGETYWDDPTIDDPPASYYCSADLQPGRRYWWTARVWTSCGFSDWSDTCWFTTTCDEIAAPDPYVYEEHGCAAGGLYYIWWDSVPGAEGYLKYCEPKWGDEWFDQSDWKNFVAVGGLGEWTILLRTFSSCDTSDTAVFTAVIKHWPAVPNLVSPSDGAPDIAQPIPLDWSDVPDYLDYYELQIDTNPAFADPDAVERLESDFVVAGLVDGTQHFWRVKACNLLCGCSNWSDIWSFGTSCPVLSSPDSSTLSPPDGSSGPLEVTFQWEEVEDAWAYAFRIDTVAPGPQNVWYYDTVSVNGITLSIPPMQVYWQVRALGSPNCEPGDWTSPAGYTDVEEVPGALLPPAFSLSLNYPNPFNPETQIEFSLPRRSFVTIDIFNILGSRVRRLVYEQLSVGYKVVTWDGKDDKGKEMASGIYFYRLKAGKFTETKKMLLLK